MPSPPEKLYQKQFYTYNSQNELHIYCNPLWVWAIGLTWSPVPASWIYIGLAVLLFQVCGTNISNLTKKVLDAQPCKEEIILQLPNHTWQSQTLLVAFQGAGRQQEKWNDRYKSCPQALPEPRHHIKNSLMWDQKKNKIATLSWIHFFWLEGVKEQGL